MRTLKERKESIISKKEMFKIDEVELAELEENSILDEGDVFG